MNRNAKPKPYPTYKKSDVPWIGEIPKDWEITQTKRVCKTGSGGTPDTSNPTYYGGPIPWITTSELRESAINSTNKTITAKAMEDNPQLKMYQSGSIVIAMYGATIGRLGWLEKAATVNQACCVFNPKEAVNRKFLLYWLQHCKPHLLSSAQGGGQPNLNQELLKELPICIPTILEQAAIVRYLDEADQKIQEYISAKEKLIALLEEQRQAIIHQAVTRGLDPNVKLKPSGMEWLGDVPEHWEVSRIKNEVYSLNHKRIPLSTTERGAMSIRRYDYYGASGVIDKVDNYLFDDELLLVAEDGANLILRNLPLAIIARGKFWVNNHAHILEPKHGNLEFLAWRLEGIDYTPWISGAAQPKLTQDRLMSIPIAVPNKEQQDKIMEQVSSETEYLQTAIDQVRRQIELMQEYRTRLIADVVTGKLDVR